LKQLSVLITGASGLLGANLVLAAADTGQVVIAVSHRHRVRLEDGETTLADLSEPGVADELIGRVRPSVVIHTAAATDVDACERDPSLAFRMNEGMASAVAAAAAEAGARLIHISTDAVFGTHGEHGEEDMPEPLNVYGATKLAGEMAVLAAHPAALVVRTTIYGWNALSKSSLAEWFLKRLRRGERTGGFSDAWMSPILVNDLADALLELSEGKQHGVLHVAGAECVSKADFGRRIAAVFGLDPDLIYPLALSNGSLSAQRGTSQCLRVSRAESLLARRLPDVSSGLRRFRLLEETGHRDRLRALMEAPA
jgi:dTDP-4-dehydrorhamnose reductase